MKFRAHIEQVVELVDELPPQVRGEPATLELEYELIEVLLGWRVVEGVDFEVVGAAGAKWLVGVLKGRLPLLETPRVGSSATQLGLTDLPPLGHAEEDEEEPGCSVGHMPPSEYSNHRELGARRLGEAHGELPPELGIVAEPKMSAVVAAPFDHPPFGGQGPDTVRVVDECLKELLLDLGSDLVIFAVAERGDEGEVFRGPSRSDEMSADHHEIDGVVAFAVGAFEGAFHVPPMRPFVGAPLCGEEPPVGEEVEPAGVERIGLTEVCDHLFLHLSARYFKR